MLFRVLLPWTERTNSFEQILFVFTLILSLGIYLNFSWPFQEILWCTMKWSNSGRGRVHFSLSYTWSWFSVWSPSLSQASSSCQAPETQKIKPEFVSFRVSTHPFLSLFLLTPFLMFLLLGPSLSQRFLIFLKIDNGMSECAKWPCRPPGRQRQGDILLPRNPSQS